MIDSDRSDAWRTDETLLASQRTPHRMARARLTAAVSVRRCGVYWGEVGGGGVESGGQTTKYGILDISQNAETIVPLLKTLRISSYFV